MQWLSGKALALHFGPHACTKHDPGHSVVCDFPTLKFFIFPYYSPHGCTHSGSVLMDKLDTICGTGDQAWLIACKSKTQPSVLFLRLLQAISSYTMAKCVGVPHSTLVNITTKCVWDLQSFKQQLIRKKGREDKVFLIVIDFVSIILFLEI